MKARLATYDGKTRPLIDFYRTAGLLQSVDGARGLEEIYKDVERIVNAD